MLGNRFGAFIASRNPKIPAPKPSDWTTVSADPPLQKRKRIRKRKHVSHDPRP